ncbi:MAG TPA: hypothetical protein H9785_10610 [Candidatus Bacteroides intestinavium]|uniref:Fimbrial subunit protein C-terminal domain-containing protein n=1 Tax=Candidatus Bacteroides intestinavium TaxID=2838469 RepID=A0A9D2HUI9_9BACE|nr:hypothetical protein [Candidatus Bacteroides intestinavium]
MKKQYLLMAAFASAMAFTACSNEDDLGGIDSNPVINEVVEGATFEISISNQGVGTKAVRPMGSSAADNSVNTVALKVYKYDTDAWQEVTLASDESSATGGKIALKYVEGQAKTNAGSILTNGVIEYDADVEESVPGDDQHITKKAKIEVIGLENNAKYQIVAYGYNDDKGSSNVGYPYSSGPTAAGTGFENGVFQANVGTLQNPVHQLEEIFAASDVAETTLDKESSQAIFTVTPSLTLTRQVAGMLAYFKNVPIYLNKMDDPSDTHYKVEKLEIVANHKSADFYFPAMLLDNDDFNGIIAANDEEEVLLTFDFSKIAKNYQSPEKGATFYTFDGPSATTPNVAPYAEGYYGTPGLELQENTIFGARYLLPYDQHYGNSTTLVLRFYGKDTSNNYVLLEERDVTTENVPEGANMYTYDIRCNNFYSIGQKLATDTTDPDPDDPDDDDDPIDLTGKTINLRINDAWAVLHNMGIE